MSVFVNVVFVRVFIQLVPSNYKMHRHCFCGSWAEALAWLVKFPNSFIGLTPIITSKFSRGPREVARNIPLNRLLLETDAPYFIPRNLKV